MKDCNQIQESGQNIRALLTSTASEGGERAFSFVFDQGSEPSQNAPRAVFWRSQDGAVSQKTGGIIVTDPGEALRRRWVDCVDRVRDYNG